MSYRDELRAIRLTGKKPEKKKAKSIPKRKKPISRRTPKQANKKVEIQGEREEWFAARRQELTGKCRCGCGRSSSKNDNVHFRSSICHIFPKSKFESVQYHSLNYVERAFWGGCHANMDDRSITRWPKFADWLDIKRKFYILAPLLTPQERTKKFFHQLEDLINHH